MDAAAMTRVIRSGAGGPADLAGATKAVDGPAGFGFLPPSAIDNIDRAAGPRIGGFLERDEGFRANVSTLLDQGALDGSLVIDMTGHGIPDAGVMSRAGFDVSLDTSGLSGGSLYRELVTPNLTRVSNQFRSYGQEIDLAPRAVPRGQFLAIDGHRTQRTWANRVPQPKPDTPVVLLTETPLAGDIFEAGNLSDPALGQMLLKHMDRGGQVRAFGIDPTHGLSEVREPLRPLVAQLADEAKWAEQESFLTTVAAELTRGAAMLARSGEPPDFFH